MIIDKMIAICNKRIAKKGEGVKVSFYVFFENKNTNPELLMQAAKLWIMEHKLDHFELAVKVKKLLKN